MIPRGFHTTKETVVTFYRNRRADHRECPKMFLNQTVHQDHHQFLSFPHSSPTKTILLDK